MTDSIDERLLRLEEDRDTQRQRWIAAAAKNAGLHDPGLAVQLIDRTRIATAGDADRAVAAFAEQHPYMRPEQITEDEQKRRWGQELLDMLDRSR
jgi:hypothetical protein